MTPTQRRVLTRVALAAVAVAVLAVALPRWFADDPLVVTATFDDVGSLVPRAHVRVGDVPVGTVRSLEVTPDHRGLVTMAIDRDAPVPSQVTAVLRQTSLLGERYVDLVPVPGAGGRLTDGEVVDTRAEGTLEDLVRGGNTLLAGVGADALANAIRVGAATFEGRGATLGGVLDDLGSYTATLAGGTDELGRFLDASARLASTLAPDAETNAAALEDLADLVGVLLEEEEQLTVALTDLAAASEVGTAILREERELIDRLVLRLRRTVGELVRVDGALENAMFWLVRHNLHVPGGVVSEFSQVATDITVCGLNDDPDDPSNACIPPNPGQPNDPAPGYQSTACQVFHVQCEGIYAYPPGVYPHRGELEASRVTQAEIDAAIDFAMRTVANRGQRPRPADSADPRVSPPTGHGGGG